MQDDLLLGLDGITKHTVKARGLPDDAKPGALYWAEKVNQIGLWSGVEWLYKDAEPGDLVYIRDENQLFTWDGVHLSPLAIRIPML